jgi:hypothetical protein
MGLALQMKQPVIATEEQGLLPLPSHAVKSADLSCWPSIYEPSINLAICARDPDPELRQFAQAAAQLSLGVTLSLSSIDALDAQLKGQVRNLPGYSAWLQDVGLWIEALQCLFDSETIGLRLRTLDGVMCPRFHVDNTPVRLVTTYGDPSTEWLANEDVDRRQLGPRASALGDVEVGLYRDGVRRLPPFSVALMKGEGWDGNTGGGLVHRSPQLQPSQRRLLLTLDPLG